MQATAKSMKLARQQRRAPSLPEVLLWRHLRGNPGGVHFRRQHVIGPFVADFYCAAAKLVIEIDGIAHDLGDRPQRDARRDQFLVGLGLAVVRIPATDVLSAASSVADQLVRRCTS
jgi:very-short-patch-repair endonuclease